MHLAIAKRYIEKNGGIKNPRDFYDGNILPDLTADKDATHYGARVEEYDLVRRHAEKVNPQKFLEHNSLDNDIARGKFLHLLVDWEFYNNFVPIDYVKSVSSLDELSRDMIYTFCIIHDKWIEKEYDVSYAMSSHEKQITQMIDEWTKKDIERWGENYVGRIVLSKQQTQEFIERISGKEIIAP